MIIFGDRCVIDIDVIFKETNHNFAILLENLGLTTNFDFSKRNNKKLYTHEFIKTFCEFLKQKTHLNFVFFSNNLTKDKFRNQLLKKIERIFSIKIWSENYDLMEFHQKILNNDARVISGLELLFENRTTPSFRKISKYLEKEGLTFLSESYFQDIVNKMIIFNH
jgi:hypothetical protein